jgi:hypothetical protein
MLLSDDKSPVLDASGSGVPALLYLNETTPPRQVGVKFNSEGRIGAITDGVSIYYVSRGEYKQLNTSIDYDAMLANSTIRKGYLKIEPGESMLQFIDIINGKLAQSNVNHTLQGTLEALEPHIIAVGASPGRYELRMRVENAVNAIQTFGQFFNVTAAEMRGVSLSDARAVAGGEASITLQTPKSNNEKWINISYDAARLKPVSISGECKASWQVDAIEGRITAHLPAGCAVANLTFAVSSKAQANETIKLNLTSSRGFKPETVTNGVITIAASDRGTKKSPAMGVLAGLVALAAGAGALFVFRRRG